MDNSASKKRLLTWQEMVLDTPLEVKKLQIAMYQKLPMWKRWQLIQGLNRTGRRLAIHRIRQQHPEATENEVRYHLAVLLYGVELADKVYGQFVNQNE